MYGGKEIANTNLGSIYRIVFPLSHQMLWISYGRALREKDSLIDGGEKKKNISREDIILWFLSDFLYQLFFLLLLVKEVNTSHLLKKYVRKSDARRACDRRKERSFSLSSSLSFNACISGKTERRSRKNRRKGIARRTKKKKKRKKGSWDINFQLFSSLFSSLKMPRSNVIREKYLRKLSLGNQVPSIESKLRLDKCFNTF